MMKSNLLVQCPLPKEAVLPQGTSQHSSPDTTSPQMTSTTPSTTTMTTAAATSTATATATHVQGYQILRLDFEAGLDGNIKRDGARRTQKIPAETAMFEMSAGRTGRSVESSMAAGTSFSATVTSRQGGKLLRLKGVLVSRQSKAQESKARMREEDEGKAGREDGGVDDTAFRKFVIERPYKMLAQQDSTSMCFAAVGGERTSFPLEGVMGVQVSELALDGLLNQLLPKDVFTKIEMSRVRCFLQPEYLIVDRENTKLAV